MPNKYGKPTEAEEQTTLFEWAAFIPELKYMYAVPNGGSRHPKEAMNLKRQGVKAGVPDICLPLPKGGYHGMYLEMKVGKNKTSEAQKEYLAYLASVGYATAVCYSFEEARNTLVKYIGL